MMLTRDFRPGDLVWFDPGVGYVLPGEVVEFHRAAQVKPFFIDRLKLTAWQTHFALLFRSSPCKQSSTMSRKLLPSTISVRSRADRIWDLMGLKTWSQSVISTRLPSCGIFASVMTTTTSTHMLVSHPVQKNSIFLLKQFLNLKKKSILMSFRKHFGCCQPLSHVRRCLWIGHRGSLRRKNPGITASSFVCHRIGRLQQIGHQIGWKSGTQWMMSASRYDASNTKWF